MYIYIYIYIYPERRTGAHLPPAPQARPRAPAPNAGRVARVWRRGEHQHPQHWQPAAVATAPGAPAGPGADKQAANANQLWSRGEMEEMSRERVSPFLPSPSPSPVCTPNYG